MNFLQKTFQIQRVMFDTLGNRLEAAKILASRQAI